MTGKRRVVDLLLNGELETVTRGLEDELYSWEELDQPHNAQGATPLISACQMGLDMVMHFLLERGADVTMCNHRNQTALHVSQPDLQNKLLAAMMRPLNLHAQLLEVAWRGDIRVLQHLLHKTDSVDINLQNQNGLTPLMLAVRDVDLFEKFKGTLEWDYNPTEVVKTLLAQSAKMDIQDQKSCTVLTYASQIKSSMKDELLQIILVYQTVSEPTYVMPAVHFPSGCFNSSHNLSSLHMFSTLANMKDVNEPYSYIAVQEDHKNFKQDKIIALYFQSAMEPKTKSKATGWRTLPSLRETDKCWDKYGILSPNSDVPVKKSLLPMPPRLKEKTKTIYGPPSVSHLSQISQSAPNLALLDASFLLQVRTNIHNRLSVSGNEGQRDPLSNPCLRTPKHLTPLDQENGDDRLLSNLQYPLEPKVLSLGLNENREKFSRLSSSTSRNTGKGSEESSCSSQSSLDEEEVNSIHRTEQMFGSLQRTSHIAQEIMNSQVTEVTKLNKSKPVKSKFTQWQKPEAVAMQNSGKQLSEIKKPLERTLDMQKICESLDDCEENETIHSAHILKMNKNMKLRGSLSNEPEPKDKITEGRAASADEESSPFVDTEEHHVSSVNIALQPTPPETRKSKKTNITKEIKCRSSYNNQTDHVLEQINMKWNSGNPKKNKRNQSPQGRNKEIALIDNITCEETSSKLDRPKMVPIKIGPKFKDVPLSWKRTPESLHQEQQNGTKKILNKPQSQKQLLNRDMKIARQAKGPATLGTHRTKSSLDYVSYRDMFLEILQADEGPAIFEMFATPIYENLRTGSSVDRPKQVQSQFKRQLNGQQRPKKPVEGSRRKQKRMISKGKQYKRKSIPPSDQVSDSKLNNSCANSDADGNKQVRKHKPPTNEEDERHGSAIKLHAEPMFSMIREVPSDTDTRTSFSNQQGHLSSSNRTPYLSMQLLQPETDYNTNQGDVISKILQDSVTVQPPSEPLINTWTSERTQSPIYQRFLDEVGEGPVTDDLLKHLAEELSYLEEKEVETLKPKNPKKTDDTPSDFKDIVSEVNPLKNLLHSERSSVGNTITWTKGEILGRGAYGTVYCGLTSQGQLIAVKQVILDVTHLETAEKEYDQLEREVDLLKNLQHQNIVGFLGTALSDHIISILMEYIPGGSISNVLNRFGPLPEKVFALYTRQILEGVVYLHDKRVIHRDLKGNNIMLMPSGIIKLIDFGCARRLNCLTQSGSQSDLLKSVHGTPYWMAPEVINETGHGKKSDIWSIGCTVFEMATGKPPLSHMSKMAALFYIGAQRGLMPSLPDDFSEEAQGFVQACLTNDQKQRPSAAELLRHPFVFHLRQSTTNQPSDVIH